MTTPHADLADEFRALARAALERMEPLLRGADGETDAEQAQAWQGCTWCPLCAAAALIKGERHPLIGVLARESDHVLTALRMLLHDHAGAANGAHAGAANGAHHGAAGGAESAGTDRSDEQAHDAAAARPVYQPIEVTVDDGSAGD